MIRVNQNGPRTAPNRHCASAVSSYRKPNLHVRPGALCRAEIGAGGLTGMLAYWWVVDTTFGEAEAVDWVLGRHLVTQEDVAPFATEAQGLPEASHTALSVVVRTGSADEQRLAVADVPTREINLVPGSKTLERWLRAIFGDRSK
jgi:hypothetical protein